MTLNPLCMAHFGFFSIVNVAFVSHIICKLSLSSRGQKFLVFNTLVLNIYQKDTFHYGMS